MAFDASTDPAAESLFAYRSSDGSTRCSVKYLETSKETKTAIEKLSKEALGASAKILRKKLKADLPVRTNHLKNHVASWKRIERSTGQPILDFGFYGWQKVRQKNKVPSRANPDWKEFGTAPHAIEPVRAKKLYDKSTGIEYGFYVAHPGQKATHLLRNTIQNNITEIRAAQEEYLKKIDEILDIRQLQIKETEDEETD